MMYCCKVCNKDLFIKDHLLCVVSLDRVGFVNGLKQLNEESFNNGEYDKLREKILPELSTSIFYENSEPKIYKRGIRDSWIGHYLSWCLPPSSKLVNEIKDFVGSGTILELGGGTGFYASILQKSGLRVICTDNYSEFKFFGNGMERCFFHTEVERLSATEAIKKYGNICDTLLVVWGRGQPSKEDLKHFEGNKVIVIGEDSSGCTNAGIFSYLQYIHEEGVQPKEDDVIYQEWKITKTRLIECWEYINDQIDFFERE